MRILLPNFSKEPEDTNSGTFQDFCRMTNKLTKTKFLNSLFKGETKLDLKDIFWTIKSWIFKEEVLEDERKEGGQKMDF